MHCYTPFRYKVSLLMCAWETVLRMEPVKRRVAQLIRKKKAKWADEPGSVVDDHLSTGAVTDAL